MSLDREGIERKSPTETLAAAVSEQVRGIVEAAEKSAEEILRGAELEAQDIRTRASQATEQATGEAQRVRERATTHAREYVERLSASISRLLGRLDAIDGELNSLTVSLRSETERLRGELAALEDELEDVTGATDASARAFEPPPSADPARAAARFSDPVPAPESAKLGDEPVAAFPPAGAEPSTEAGVDLAASEQPTSQDIEGARLIALNMALNGTPREETERYLAENYDLANRQHLLDEVYASVQS